MLGLGVLAKGWLMNSDAGSRFIMNRVSNSLSGKLSVSAMKGNLDDGLTLSGMQFEQDGLVVAIQQLEARAEVSLLPPQINVIHLRVQDLKISQASIEATSQKPPLSVEDILAGLSVPIAINMEDVLISGVDIPAEGEETSLHLDSVSLNGRWKDDIELHQLDIKAPMFDAVLQGHVALKPPYEHHWKTRLKLPDTVLSQIPGESVDFELTVEGDANSTQLNASSEQTDIKINGFITSPFKEALLNLDFSAGRVVWATDETADAVRISGLSGVLKGPADNYHLSLQTKLEIEGLPVIHLSTAGQGDFERLIINSMEAKADFLDVDGTGVLQWAETGLLDVNLDVRRFEPSLWASDWPREHFLSGKLSLLTEDSGFRVRDLSVKISGTDVDINGEGVFEPGAGTLAASLSWQRLRWPLGLEAYELSSDSGLLNLSGSPTDWLFEGSLELDTREYPGGSFELTGSGGIDSATISIGKGEALGGTLAGKAILDWRESFRWNADLDVKQVDTGVLLPDWPARLDAKLSLLQDSAKDFFKLEFDSLDGEFKGEGVHGNGGIVFEKSTFRFREVQLRSGSSTISLDGQFEGSMGLEFEVEVQKPGWASDLIGGEISGRGRVALGAPEPVIDINLKAQNLEWGEARVENILLKRGPETGADGLSLMIEAEDLEFENYAIQTLQAVLAGDREEQTLEVKAIRSDVRLEAKLVGAISDWKSLADSDWRGQLTNLTLASGSDSLATLQKSAPLVISARELSLGRACLLVTDSGGLCVKSNRAPDGRIDLEASLSELSLGVSQLVHAHEIDFTQSLDGDIRWEKIPGQLPSGHVSIKITAGQFGEERADIDHVTTAEGFFGFELDNGNLTAGQLDIPFPGIGQIDLDYAISGLALDGTGKVDGKIMIDLNDISVLEQLLPGLGNISGNLNTDLRVAGVTSDPAINGNIVLRDGSADISYLGTQLRRVNLDGAVSSKDNVTLQGEFTAGEGQGEVDVKMKFADWSAPAMEMTFSGSSLRMLNIPELRMEADADFKLAWEHGEWLIDGGVVVQQARIAPVSYVVGRVTESEDIQLVAGSVSLGGQEETVKPFRLTGQLEVSLGDQVKIDTDMAKADLTGAVTLTWNEESIPIANGSIHANGKLAVFGPVLHVEDGRVRFPGIPVNNPMLDLRAERDIFGNTQIRTAGVSITGSAKRPVIEAYTNPYTTSDRAWAVLITGSDVEYGQGVGAFEVGTYIAPKLYLSYGISLFDDDNVVSARYDLKKGFGVKASSGQRESGIDMSYTIDR